MKSGVDTGKKMHPTWVPAHQRGGEEGNGMTRRSPGPAALLGRAERRGSEATWASASEERRRPMSSWAGGRRKAELGQVEGEEQAFGRGGGGQAEENHGPKGKACEFFSKFDFSNTFSNGFQIHLNLESKPNFKYYLKYTFNSNKNEQILVSFPKIKFTTFKFFYFLFFFSFTSKPLSNSFSKAF